MQTECNPALLEFPTVEGRRVERRFRCYRTKIYRPVVASSMNRGHCAPCQSPRNDQICNFAEGRSRPPVAQPGLCVDRVLAAAGCLRLVPADCLTADRRKPVDSGTWHMRMGFDVRCAAVPIDLLELLWCGKSITHRKNLRGR